MPTLADAGDAMFLRYAGEGLSHLAVEVEGSLVDEDVEARALEHSLDLGEHGLYMCTGYESGGLHLPMGLNSGL